MLYRPQSYHLLIVDRPRAFPEILSKFRASDVAVITARNALEAEAKLFLYGDQTIDALWINIDLPESDLERLPYSDSHRPATKKVQVFVSGIRLPLRRHRSAELSESKILYFDSNTTSATSRTTSWAYWSDSGGWKPAR